MKRFSAVASALDPLAPSSTLSRSSKVDPLVSTSWLSKNLDSVSPLCVTLPNHFWYKVHMDAPRPNAVQYILGWFNHKSHLSAPKWTKTVLEAQASRVEFEKWYVKRSNPQVLVQRELQRQSNPECHTTSWIPTSLSIGLDEVSDPESMYPYMAPSFELFHERMRALGLNRDDHIVCYGKDLGDFSATDPTSLSSLAAAARFRLILNMFGFNNVSILDGGLFKWSSELRKSTSVPMTPTPSLLNVQDIPAKQAMIQYPELLKSIAEFAYIHNQTVIDTRSPIEFEGKSKQAILSCGHIPTSKNICIDDLFDKTLKTMLDASSLNRLFANAGVPMHPEHRIILVSNLGISACLMQLALERAGKTQNVFVFDGGWTEWRSHKSSPISRN